MEFTPLVPVKLTQQKRQETQNSNFVRKISKTYTRCECCGFHQCQCPVSFTAVAQGNFTSYLERLTDGRLIWQLLPMGDEFAEVMRGEFAYLMR